MQLPSRSLSNSSLLERSTPYLINPRIQLSSVLLFCHTSGSVTPQMGSQPLADDCTISSADKPSEGPYNIHIQGKVQAYFPTIFFPGTIYLGNNSSRRKKIFVERFGYLMAASPVDIFWLHAKMSPIDDTHQKSQ